MWVCGCHPGSHVTCLFNTGVASPELIHYFAYWPALVLTFIAVLVGRLANVGIGTWLVNRFRTGGDKVTQKEQFVLWFSGLRGGVAFALATGTQSVLTNKCVGDGIS